MKRCFVYTLLVLGVTSTALGATADAFPSRSSRIVVNTAPDGLTHPATRLVSQHMGTKPGQSVRVKYTVSVDGLLGIRHVKDRSADGYTLPAAAGTVAVQPAVSHHSGYDRGDDFTGIGCMVRSTLLMVEGSDQPGRMLAGPTACAKANPGKSPYASADEGIPRTSVRRCCCSKPVCSCCTSLARASVRR